MSKVKDDVPVHTYSYFLHHDSVLFTVNSSYHCNSTAGRRNLKSQMRYMQMHCFQGAASDPCNASSRPMIFFSHQLPLMCNCRPPLAIASPMLMYHWSDQGRPAPAQLCRWQQSPVSWSQQMSTRPDSVVQPIVGPTKEKLAMAVKRGKELHPYTTALRIAQNQKHMMLNRNFTATVVM